MTDERPTGRFVPAMLILLSAVPVVAGAARLTELTGGAEITPENARFFAVPLPVVLHIVSVSVYSVLGAFQFAPGFRRRRPGWHRAAGRVLVPSGLVAALTGLWMTVFYPYPAGGSDLLSGIRLVFGTAMALSIVLGFAAIRRRDVVRHRAWMIRGYAIGLGGHAGADPPALGPGLRGARRGRHRTAHGRRLGDQRGRGRVGRPQAAGGPDRPARLLTRPRGAVRRPVTRAVRLSR
ncbi:DUF2306 domain-containing protein [Planomonospora parontospora]|uniref:DUF2306 domain-containing protein n=1 Tax=Planomonospora parontospora TaxID=58119 RepID=UPI003610D3FC